MYVLACLLVLVAAYLANILTISIGYHRGLAHGAVTLSPRTRRFVVVMGNWITGLDPKAWVVMHRLHHAHSDTPDDPHSPVNVGLLGIFREQLHGYERVLVGLAKQKPKYTELTQGLDFELNWLNRKGLWFLPYVLHASIALAIGLTTGLWLLAVCYFLGMMSHPLQGGVVNALGHAVGRRNFNTPDNSRNNLIAAALIFGEGFQNNHHMYPASAKFSYTRSEIDLGYGMCLLGEALGLLRVERALLIPQPDALLASPA